MLHNVDEIIERARFILPSIVREDEVRNYAVEPDRVLNHYHIIHRPRPEATRKGIQVLGYLSAPSNPSSSGGKDFSTTSLVTNEGTTLLPADENALSTSAVDKSVCTKDAMTSLAQGTKGVAKLSKPRWSDVPKTVASSSDWKGFTCRSPKTHQSPKSTPEKKDQESNISTPPTSAGSTPEKADLLHKEAMSYEAVDTTNCGDRNLGLDQNLDLHKPLNESTKVQDSPEAKPSEKQVATALTEKQKMKDNINTAIHKEHKLPAGAASIGEGKCDSSDKVNGAAGSDQAAMGLANCPLPGLTNKVRHVPLGSRYSMLASELAFAEESFILDVNPTPGKSLPHSQNETASLIKDIKPQPPRISSESSFSSPRPTAQAESGSSAPISLKGKVPKKLNMKMQKKIAQETKKADRAAASGNDEQSQNDIGPEATVTSSALEPVTKKQQLAAKKAKEAVEAKLVELAENEVEAKEAMKANKNSSINIESSHQVIEELPVTSATTALSTMRSTMNQQSKVNEDQSRNEMVPEFTSSKPASASPTTIKLVTNKQKRVAKKARKAERRGDSSNLSQSCEQVGLNSSSPEPACVPLVAGLESVAAPDATKSQGECVHVGSSALIPSEKSDCAIQILHGDHGSALNISARLISKDKKKYKAGKKVKARKLKAALKGEAAIETGETPSDKEAELISAVRTNKHTGSIDLIGQNHHVLIAGYADGQRDHGTKITSDAISTLTPPSFPENLKPEQMESSELEDTIACIDAQSKTPNVVVTDTNDEEHSPINIAQDTSCNNSDTFADLKITGQSCHTGKSLEPFPGYKEPTDDDNRSRRPLPQGVPLSMGRLKTWMDEKKGDDDVKNIEQSENPSMVKGSPLEDPAPVEDFDDDRYPGPVKKIDEAEDPPHIDNPVEGNNPAASDDSIHINATAEALASDSDASINNTDTNTIVQEGIYNPHCLLLQGETSWIIKKMQLTSAEEVKCDEDDNLADPAIKKDKGQLAGEIQHVISEDHSAAEVPIEDSRLAYGNVSETGDTDKSDSVELTEMSTHYQHEPITSEVAVNEARPLSDDLSVARSFEDVGDHVFEDCNQPETTTNIPQSLEMFSSAASAEALAEQQTLHQEIFESFNQEEAATDISRAAEEDPTRLASSDTSANNRIGDCSMAEAVTTVLQEPVEDSIPIGSETSAEHDTPAESRSRGMDAPTNVPQLPVEDPYVIAAVASEILAEHNAPGESDSSEAEVTTDSSPPPVEDEFVLAPDQPSAPHNTAIKSDSTVVEVPVTISQSSEEMPSAVASPGGLASQDSPAGPETGTAITSALDGMNIVEVAIAVQEHPNDLFLLLSLIMVLVVKFMLLLLQGFGLRRRA